MSDELQRRIDEKDEWTFRECVGLASELNLRTPDGGGDGARFGQKLRRR